MGRFRHGHAKLDQGAGPWVPCDRCAFIWSMSDLQWQYEWAGTRLQNTQYLVCPRCLDVPSAVLRTIIPGPDPTPIPNVRANHFNYYNTSDISTEDLITIEAEDGDDLILEDTTVPVTDLLATESLDLLTTENGIHIVTGG